MTTEYVGSRRICQEAMRLYYQTNEKGERTLPHPIIAPTLRRWVNGEMKERSKFSPIRKDREYPFPVPQKAIKWAEQRGHKVFLIDRKYLYLILAWHSARLGGRRDYKNFAEELETK